MSTLILRRNLEKYHILSFQYQIRILPFLLYVKCKPQVTFAQRCVCDVSKENLHIFHIQNAVRHYIYMYQILFHVFVLISCKVRNVSATRCCLLLHTVAILNTFMDFTIHTNTGYCVLVFLYIFGQKYVEKYIEIVFGI